MGLSTDRTGTTPFEIQGVGDGERLLAWIGSGLLLGHNPTGSALGAVFQIDPDTGRREFWREIEARDSTAIMNIGSPFAITPDGRSYAYSWHRALSDLYLVSGLV